MLLLLMLADVLDLLPTGRNADLERLMGPSAEAGGGGTSVFSSFASTAGGGRACGRGSIDGASVAVGVGSGAAGAGSTRRGAASGVAAGGTVTSRSR